MGQEELLAIRNKSSSDRIFSVNLMLAVFSNEELTQPNVNVFGGVSKGNESNKENYIPLDVQRIDTLKQTVLPLAMSKAIKKLNMRSGSHVKTQ